MTIDHYDAEVSLSNQLRKEAITDSVDFSESLHARMCTAIAERASKSRVERAVERPRRMIRERTTWTASAVAISFLALSTCLLLMWHFGRSAQMRDSSVPNDSASTIEGPLDSLAMVVASQLGVDSFQDELHFQEARSADSSLQEAENHLLGEWIQPADLSSPAASNDVAQAVYDEDSYEARFIQAARLYHVEQMTITEIADALGCSPDAVQQLLGDTDFQLALADAGI